MMIQREITIGRAPDSDILFSQECVHISNHHALIYVNGDQLIYRDTSTNGTSINNTLIRDRSVVINYGDCIMLANRYVLSWERIIVFFPHQRGNGSLNNQPNASGRKKTIVSPERPQAVSDISLNYSDMSVEVATARFNWGAFFLCPFWGFANGMWWAFLIGVFLGWTMIPNLLFGIMGSKWAWENKSWRNLDHFTTVQDSWRKWGIGVFIINIFLFVLVFFIMMSLSYVFSESY